MLPTLDLQVEVIKVEYKNQLIDQISFTFFQKPRKTALVIGFTSAMAAYQKHNILSNEIIRRLSNLSKDRCNQEKIKVIDDFTRELKSSGYCRSRSR